MSDIIEAIKAGDATRVAELLDADRSLLQARDGNVTAILLAIYHGHAEIARLFADRGAELTIGEAIALGDADRVKAMAARDPSSIDSFTDDGFPAVGLAIFFRHPELARWLIEQGADVNAAAKNAARVAPLHAAAAVADRDTMRLLLERGADPNAKQQTGFTPLHSAALHGDREMAQLLVEHGADRGATSDDGKTAAAIADEHGHYELAAWLREQ
jgi:uncharacterized protein